MQETGQLKADSAAIRALSGPGRRADIVFLKAYRPDTNGARWAGVLPPGQNCSLDMIEIAGRLKRPAATVLARAGWLARAPFERLDAIFRQTEIASNHAR